MLFVAGSQSLCESESLTVLLIGHVFHPVHHFSIEAPEWLCESWLSLVRHLACFSSGENQTTSPVCESWLSLVRHLACFSSGENQTTSPGRISSVGHLRVALSRNRAREAAAAEASRTNSGKTNTRARSEASVQELRLVLVADVHRLA